VLFTCDINLSLLFDVPVTTENVSFVASKNCSLTCCLRVKEQMYYVIYTCSHGKKFFFAPKIPLLPIIVASYMSDLHVVH